eukprot:11693281-Heterocapsa_arctica.AAC.1
MASAILAQAFPLGCVGQGPAQRGAACLAAAAGLAFPGVRAPGASCDNCDAGTPARKRLLRH